MTTSKCYTEFLGEFDDRSVDAIDIRRIKYLVADMPDGVLDREYEDLLAWSSHSALTPAMETARLAMEAEMARRVEELG